MKQLEWNNRFFITGKPRTGKSWLRDYIESKYRINNKRRYFVAIDNNISNVQHLKNKGYHIEIYDRHKAKKDYDWIEFIQYHEKVAFVLSGCLQDEIENFVNNICYALEMLGDFLLMIDESWLFLKRGKNEPDEMNRVLRSSPKTGGDVLVISHRVVDLNPELISSFNTFISFQVTEPNSIKMIDHYFDRFNGYKEKLIDSDLSKKYYNKLKKLYKNNPSPDKLLKKLPARSFLYSDLDNGIQEISTTDYLS